MANDPAEAPMYPSWAIEMSIAFANISFIKLISESRAK